MPIALLINQPLRAVPFGASAEPYLVKDINPSGDSRPLWLTNVNGVLFFTADNGTVGQELWRSDGTEAGTVMVKDINSGDDLSAPRWLYAVNNELYFSADDGSHGRELWKSDGTEAGTMMVKDINPDSASSDPFWMFYMYGKLFFQADDGIHGEELWALPIPLPEKNYLPLVTKQ